MASTAKQKAAAEAAQAKGKLWELRIWSGMTAGGWFRLLARNRFAVSPSRVPMAMTMTLLSLYNSCMHLVQELIYGRRIAATGPVDDPIFVLGHWRSGTTLLHELLIADPQHTYPDTYTCFTPNHFLLTERFMTWWLKYLLPSRRPMDNMAVGFKRPQEDEWALCNMGLPSIYFYQAFPNRPPQCREYFDLREVPPEALQRWKRKLRWFLKCLTVKSPKRIVLKTPQHTCRIRVLLEMFPKARFVHIVRNPYAIYPSTIKAWKSMSQYHGLQVSRYEGLEEMVVENFSHMYEVFEEQRHLIDPARFCEVRFEDLVADPIGQMRRIYESLGLDGFDAALPALRSYTAGTADYRPNRFELDADSREIIGRRWGDYARRYGYAAEPVSHPSGQAPDEPHGSKE